MNLKFYLEKLNSSKEFKKFKKEDENCFLCSGFFLIDKLQNNFKVNFDYYIPSKKQMFSFELGEEIQKNPIENFGKNFIPEEIFKEIDFDFNEIEKIIIKKFQEEKINKKIQKILLSLQSKNKNSFLIGTIFISGLGMIKFDLDLKTNKIINFERKSFFDIIKIVKKK